MPLAGHEIARLRNVTTRSISPENVDGAKGGGGRATEGTGAYAARDLGPGWKISPSVIIGAGNTYSMAIIDGPGLITHIWLTTDSNYWRTLVLRAYWDHADEPAIEVPLGDFFASGWGRFAQVSSSMIAVNPHGGFNCYWPMPFQRNARLTVENIGSSDAQLYYQVTYENDRDVDGLGYLHAQFRRNNPLTAGEMHVLLDGVTGQGHYVGTYIAWGVNSPGWWGEGELKVYLDGDQGYPTICGTGTEDYFGGAWNFDVPGRGYTEYTTPYLGMPQVIRPDGLYQSQQRFGLYRWHVPDPIHFSSDLRAEIQALGWQFGGRYRPLQDDIASTALFYLDRPSTQRPSFPLADALRTDA
jgi:D-arabinan exo alpha-(1,3)/(1,5)-arabinofuranosidase (non-reducing end)